jgi:predicted metalloprotease with PDZ domain
MDRLASRMLHVEVVLRGVNADSVLWRDVPAYMDNPTPRARDQAVRGLMARTAAGTPVAIRSRATLQGETLHVVGPVSGEMHLSYDLLCDFADSPQTERYGIQLPFVDDERGWLYGNCVFLTPVLAADRARSVRLPVDVRVRFLLPPEIPLVAVPGDTLRLSCIYDLVSVQFGLGRYFVEDASAGRHALRFVYRDSLEYDAGARRILRERSVRCLEAVRRFMDADAPGSFALYYFRKGQAGMGGLEGTNALQAYMPPDHPIADDAAPRTRVFWQIVVHEMIHWWHPVCLYALEDPWIKEGWTSYYGNVLAARLGLMQADDVDRMLDRYLRELATNEILRTVSLTDARIWEHEYDGEDWRTLTYERGMIVALLLDVHLREKSGNRRSLDDVQRHLVDRYACGGYTHAQLLAAIETATGVDVGSWFAAWVDGTRTATEAEARAALARARELGVFAAGIP